MDYISHVDIVYDEDGSDVSKSLTEEEFQQFGNKGKIRSIKLNRDMVFKSDGQVRFTGLEQFNDNGYTFSLTGSSKNMFWNSKHNPSIYSWDVSGVTSMSCMFQNTDSFNQPIGGWDTSRVTDMTAMFMCTHNFNQPLQK